jgi:hypothetical protein
MVKTEHIALLFYVLASTAGVVIIKKYFESARFEDIFSFLGQLFSLQQSLAFSCTLRDF